MLLEAAGPGTANKIITAMIHDRHRRPNINRNGYDFFLSLSLSISLSLPAPLMMTLTASFLVSPGRDSQISGSGSRFLGVSSRGCLQL